MLERVAANRARDASRMPGIETRALERNAAHRDWICDERRMALTAGGGALYMHCLPADIGAEVTPGVMDTHRVNVARQANKKLYVIMALLADGQGAGSRARVWRHSDGEHEIRDLDTRHDDRHAGRARPAARGAHPPGGDPHPRRLRGPARGAGRRSRVRPRNHEGPRLEYLRRTLIEIGAVRRPRRRRVRRVRQPRLGARGSGRRHPARQRSASSTGTATATR